MEKEPSPQELLKIQIFEAYRNCINPSSPDISKYIGQLWVLINKWCEKYLFVEEWQKQAVEELVVEIPKIIDKLIKKDLTIDGFFPYLYPILERKIYKILSKQLPKGVNRKKIKEYFRINRLIEFKEIEIGNKLTENEREGIIIIYMSIKEYAKIKNQLNSLSLDDEYSDDEDNDTNEFGVSPEELREAITYVLENKRQKRTWDCNRALFTVYCIFKKASLDYLDKLAPALDKELLEAYRESKIRPTQYDIYIIYHPGRKNKSEKSVRSNARNDLAKFLKDLRIYLNEKKS